MIWNQNILELLKNKPERHFSSVFTFVRKNLLLPLEFITFKHTVSQVYRGKYNSLEVSEEIIKLKKYRQMDKSYYIVTLHNLRKDVKN